MRMKRIRAVFLICLFPCLFLCFMITCNVREAKQIDLCPATKLNESILLNDENNNYEFKFCWRRIYALGDIHGDLENTLKILIAAGITNNKCEWTGGKSLLVQTGDIWDRGPDGVEVFSLLMHLKKYARLVGGEVILLLGNHDVLNMFNIFHYAHVEETNKIGGIEKRKAAFSKTGLFGYKSRQFSFILKVNDIIFVHAGVNRQHARLGLKKINELGRKEVNNINSYDLQSFETIIGVDGPLWTRVYFEELSRRVNAKEEDTSYALFYSLKHLNGNHIVVGHTPQQTGRIETYYGNRLIAIDTGLSKYMYNSPHILKIHNNVFYDVSIQKSKCETRKLF